MTDHETLRGADAGDLPTAVAGPGGPDPLYPEVALHPEDGTPVPPEPGGVPPGGIPPDEIPPEGGGGDPEPTPAERRRSFWKELPFLILIALLVAVLIKTFLVQAFWIPSGSMEETLQINDRVLVSKLSYRFGDISRGDVVVFDDPRGVQSEESVPEAVWRNLLESVGLSTPKSEYIKRVIGLPGETVQVRGGKVEIDGVPIDEPWVHPFTSMPDFGPETVGEGQLFVMGDNRNASQDSRVFGPIEEDTVVGRAFVVLWPPSRWGGL